ncbi:MAG TPA: pyridoxamine 5'-phosphate oxidase family protein [SAR202 cluster bacterium]|jgi:PPOX class probable F420-dependent enzyme|nr:pyridoxamine 5'-phosphate oxidase family protein [SAR202 cluster bacterium]|tara:strand:+ start:3375 stop:3791 length:417 start_codon:yes stop_codon:yes gene_type:complete
MNLDPFDKEQLFSDPNVAILATVDNKNRAHGMPIWYMYQYGKFVMTAGKRSQKTRNIERMGKATLVIDRREPPYHAVMIRGRAEIGPAPGATWLLRLAIRYLGEERGKTYFQGLGDDIVTITLYPDDVIEYLGVSGRA